MNTEYIKIKNHINGKWLDETNGQYEPLKNPSTGAVIGEVPLSSVQTSQAAVLAAAEAFPAWSATPLPKRMNYIFDMQQAMKDNLEMLAQAIAIDQAKHIAEARGEVGRVIEILQMACSIPAMIQGETVQGIANNINGRIIKAPLGVFCGVAPFNFPALVFGWFIPFAIGSGNTFVYKPSTESPLFMQKMMQLLVDIGLPDGVVNIVHGDRETVEAWYEDDNVAGVCLVGSTPTAKAIAEGCGRGGKKTMLLGGAKNFLVAMEDAPMDLMIENILMSGYGSAGQRCLAVSNIAVVPEIYDEFVERLLAASKDITIGDAMNPDVFMGPVISAKAKERIENYIEIGQNEGATLALDGRNPSVAEGNKNGYFIGPTVFTDVTPCMQIAREEIFGPVLNVMKVGCINGALRMIKNHEMGNGAVIFTQNSYYTEKFINEADVGMVGVNVGICAPHPYLPFGGIKGSLVGNNKVQGKSAVDFFTQNKVATVRVVDPKENNAAPVASSNAAVRSCVAS
ncbi:aldehyde dehydrogenase family protein [Neptunomonas japonica]|uniref:methylmalonate-semialdehyde dehydrogenase (CoA acylating) n=1 Tax=Neptunomonas japonica JAMM 1380 TaxID=1441457 RepID=A0A7R6PX66_9GAMM|nr:aldehyde dehydrogenase family protein [Neptunomonas japonica]BBB31198.1 malonate-semialdehyde dehydrogenase (acetylating)/methylmalonate-semialdehyde dehydrogenase [Neptunomonas japonica JAMM 1380]